MKKILVIRFSSIGDIVLTTPVIRALKEQLKCEIHAVTKEKYKGLYTSNSNIDKVISFEKNESEIIGELQNEEYDFIVDLQKNIRSFRIRKSLQKPFGTFPKLNFKKWMLVNFKIDLLPDVHIVDRYFEAVKLLGVQNDGKGLDYFIPENEKVIPSSLDKRLSEKYVAYVIGGQHKTKILPAGKIAEVISGTNYMSVLLGGKEDFERGEEIVKLTGNNNVINLCGKLSLNQSASLVKQSSVVVTNDTGLMHIAAAFHKPVVSVWGNTVPKFGMYPYIPGDRDKVVISEVAGLKCRPCSKIGYDKCPGKHFKCMELQNTDFIINSVNRLLTENNI